MPKVERLDVSFKPESTADPFIIQDDRRIAFCFLATELQGDGTSKDCGYAIVTSTDVRLCKFGHPNDEALHGHPLTKHGLDGTFIAEVTDSALLNEVIQLNLKSFPDSATHFDGLRHLIFPFKETTLELLLSSFDYQLKVESFEKVRQEMLRWYDT